jgi:serine/threonine-protein kinase RsbT
MVITKDDTMPVRSSEDIVRVRQYVRERAVELGFGLVGQTKLVTAASELARNTVDYGGGGTMRLEALDEYARSGLRLTFEDHGSGIADIELALRDGYTSGKGLGLGLPGARRLMDEFAVASEPGRGTTVTMTKWRESP